MESDLYYFSNNLQNHIDEWREKIKKWTRIGLLLIIGIVYLAIASNYEPLQSIISPISTDLQSLSSDAEKNGYEVFGFAPYWTMNNLENVDFNTLTTLAYFGVDVDANGEMNRGGVGYERFMSDDATSLFQRAHDHGTRVVLTLTQMDSATIRALMDNPEGQEKVIREATELVRDRGIDGINVDFEYVGDPGPEYRAKFSSFVTRMTEEMHRQVPNSRVTVSVYASAVKEPKIYDIASLADGSDGIFMMAYDFAVASSDHVIPTSPLYGHKEGKYWYDISTAVDDFLTQMPADKLILGLPWYGYNYPVVEPGVKVARHSGYYAYAYNRWGYRYSYFVYPPAQAQTYASAMQSIHVQNEGWDDLGQVGWKAYVDGNGVWRMIFLEDERSLKIKYDFAKEKDLGGVGVWALGFDTGTNEMWSLLERSFGPKYVDNSIKSKIIHAKI